jgi:UPF0176 protein
MIKISSFYEIRPLDEEKLPLFKDELFSLASRCGVLGLIILSPEGINGTVSGADTDEFVQGVSDLLGVLTLDQKLSSADRQVFKKFNVKIRPEIVTSEFPTRDKVLSGEGQAHTLTPREWEQLLSSGEELNLIDTRNYYEYQLGRFKGAVDPGIAQFTEFSEFLEASDLPRDRKTLIYCTGGIRCEKAVFEMKRAGFSEVYQLGGGILRYLEEFPGRNFEGECFVFDRRVAVTQSLEPSKRYVLCRKCGDPAEVHDREVRCLNLNCQTNHGQSNSSC